MARVPTNASVSYKINARDLRDMGIEASAIPDVFMPPVLERRQLIAGRAGSRDLGGYYDEWSLSLACEVRGSSHNDVINKIDSLKNWIDLTQHYVDEYLVNRHDVPTLRFEIAGHKYPYTTGTVTVTNGSKIVTGSSTKWSKYLTSSAQFKVQGDETLYIIDAVNSDTEIVLSATISRATSGSLTYEAETKRALLVNYDGNSSISSPTHAHFVHEVFNLSIGFTSTYPFFVGPKKEFSKQNPSAGEFIELEGVGNAAFSNFLLQLIGSSDNPRVVAAEHSFVCSFNGDTESRNILNNAHSPATETITGYRATRQGMGIIFSGAGDHLEYTSLESNGKAFSFFIRLYPQFAYDGSGGDRTVFEYRLNANNSVRVWYDQSEQKWTFTWTGASDVTTLVSSAQTFATDVEIELYGSISTSLYDSSTYYGLLYVNGIQEDTETGSAPTEMSSNLTNLIVGSNNANDENCNCIVDELATWITPLSVDELKRMRLMDEWLLNINGMWEYTSTLDDGDVLFLNGRTGITELYDASQNAREHAGASSKGRIPSIRGDKDQKQWIYLPSSMAEFRLSYQSHWR